MWRFQLWIGAAMLAGVPVVSFFTTDSHLGQSLLLARGPLPVAAFDLVMLLFASLWGYAAWWMGQKKSAKKPSRERPIKVAPANEAGAAREAA